MHKSANHILCTTKRGPRSWNRSNMQQNWHTVNTTNTCCNFRPYALYGNSFQFETPAFLCKAITLQCIPLIPNIQNLKQQEFPTTQYRQKLFDKYPPEQHCTFSPCCNEPDLRPFTLLPWPSCVSPYGWYHPWGGMLCSLLPFATCKTFQRQQRTRSIRLKKEKQVMVYVFVGQVPEYTAVCKWTRCSEATGDSYRIT